MSSTTVRIPDDRRDLLKIIASVEKRPLGELLVELIDDYIDRHKETLELLSRPDWADAIRCGKREVAEQAPGTGLDDLEG